MNEHLHKLQLESGMCGISLRLSENIATSYIVRRSLSGQLPTQDVIARTNVPLPLSASEKAPKLNRMISE